MSDERTVRMSREAAELLYEIKREVEILARHFGVTLPDDKPKLRVVEEEEGSE